MPSSANPADALPTLFAGLWKEYLDGMPGGTFPELIVAPHVPQKSENGQFQVQDTRLFYNAQTKNAGKAAWDGGTKRLQVLKYINLATQLEPFESVPVVVNDRIKAMLEAENPDLGQLDSAMQLVERSLRGRLAQEMVDAVAALTSAGTLALGTASTNVGLILKQRSDDQLETTSFRPDVFAVGPRADTLLKNTNTIIQKFVGTASTGGADAGTVSDEGIKRYFREVAKCDYVVLERAAGLADGTAKFQWETNAFFGTANGSDIPSCLKTASPDASLFRTYVDTLRAFEGGPGQVFSAKGEVDVVVADTNLGRRYVVTL